MIWCYSWISKGQCMNYKILCSQILSFIIKKNISFSGIYSAVSIRNLFDPGCCIDIPHGIFIIHNMILAWFKITTEVGKVSILEIGTVEYSSDWEWLLQIPLQQKKNRFSLIDLTYRTRAIKGHRHCSRIMSRGLRITHKKGIKNSFFLENIVGCPLIESGL